MRHETVAEYLKRGGKVTKLKDETAKRDRESIRAMRDFERHLRVDTLIEESTKVKKIDLGETFHERVSREEAEYARNTGRCGLSFERLSGNLLD